MAALHESSHKMRSFIIFIVFISIIYFLIQIAARSISSTLQSNLQTGSPIKNFTAQPTKNPTPTSIENSCELASAQYLPAITEITPAVYVTRTVSRETIQGNGFSTDVITTKDHYIVDPNGKPPTEKEITKFKTWAVPRGIALIATNRSYDELKAGKFNLKNDQIPLENIGQVMNAYEAFMMLPDSVIEKLRGTAVYFSTVNSKTNYALYAHDDPAAIAKLYQSDQNVVRSGIFLIQPVSKRVTIHEIGHIIGTQGIQGIFGDNYSDYKDLRDEYNNIFSMQGLDKAPCGYISSYSLTNDAENFAEHFAYYVSYGSDFRKRALHDTLLRAKYLFLKNNIFEGREY